MSYPLICTGDQLLKNTLALMKLPETIVQKLDYFNAQDRPSFIDKVRVFIADRSAIIPLALLDSEIGFTEFGRTFILTNRQQFFNNSNNQSLNPELVSLAKHAINSITAPQNEIDIIIAHILKKPSKLKKILKTYFSKPK